jgi:hypothetical protein
MEVAGGEMDGGRERRQAARDDSELVLRRPS